MYTKISTSTWCSSAQSSFIPRFLVDFCKKIRRAHTVLLRSKMQEAENFLKKKFSISLEKDFIFCFRIRTYNISIYIHSHIHKYVQNWHYIQNGFKRPFSSTDFFLRVKFWKVVRKRKCFMKGGQQI